MAAWEAPEEILVPVSAIEHFSYCPRQYALIHIEQTFDENLYTLRGRAVHESVDEEGGASEEGIRVERALPIWSERLGLIGKADLVEFRGNVPYPVEYKSGRRRPGKHENLQLCAQAICLEEMLGVSVNRGAIYWHSSRGREEVFFTPEMRQAVESAVASIRCVLSENKLPPPVNDSRCKECSLKDACVPGVSARVANQLGSLFKID